MLFLLPLLLVSAQTAVAPQSAATAAPAAEAPKPKPKKICKLDPETSGSRMVKRLCLTEEEWAQHSNGMNESARSGFSGKSDDH